MRLGSTALATGRVERRLAAILAADVAGYSRLMGADEEGTHERLKALRRELADPKIKEHRGRIVKTTGDGLLIEFASVVDAVRCAVEVQREMAERNADVSPDRRIEFRMGINLGDITRIRAWCSALGRRELLRAVIYFCSELAAQPISCATVFRLKPFPAEAAAQPDGSRAKIRMTRRR